MKIITMNAKPGQTLEDIKRELSEKHGIDPNEMQVGSPADMDEKTKAIIAKEMEKLGADSDDIQKKPSLFKRITNSILE